MKISGFHPYCNLEGKVEYGYIDKGADFLPEAEQLRILACANKIYSDKFKADKEKEYDNKR